ncbi:hypothetical protein [uncultured Parasutterella sp.]|uniref:hypothetical protein n=1 Tax=uncultured Parasutterella sp. TaxID=1263098 RepID=UPI0025CD4A86|nr:hypothetical protein [uncultured Parasutterella sp.]
MEETNNKDVKFRCTFEGMFPRNLDITIKGSRFKNYDLSIVKSKEDKRYNLKLYDTDIALLDELSAVSGVSRNTLIAFVMDELLMRQLKRVGEEDTAVLIAGAADALVGVKASDLDTPWVTKYFQSRVKNAYQNTMNFGNPDISCFSDDEMAYRSCLDDELDKALLAGDERRVEELQQELDESTGHSASFFAVREKLTRESK